MAFAGTWVESDETASLRARVARLERLSRWLDIAFVIPGTRIRFGIDAIIGLVPGIGDFGGVALSSIIIMEAMQIGVPRPLIARMMANVAIEGIVGAIPILGDAFDVYWRANRRNLFLLVDHLQAEGRI